MTELDNLIEVLQGVREGRKWQSGEFDVMGTQFVPRDQSVANLLCAVRNGHTVRLAPLPDEIEFNGVMVPAPLRVAPADDTIVWYPAPWKDSYVESYGFESNDPECWLQLERGQYHLTAEAAAKHGKAMCLVQP